MRNQLTLLFITFSFLGIFAQVGINDSNSLPDASAMLDVKSTTSGLLIPRMTVVDRDNIVSPATGLVIYVTNDNSFYYFDGTNWIRIQEAGKAWLLAGNGGTSGVEFLGTTDAQPLIFKTNNIERMRIKDNGVIGVNTAPNDSYQFFAAASDKDYIGYFQSTQATSDDTGVVGIVANTDYYGIGGYFQGGWQGLNAVVYPSGNSFYYGVLGTVNGGTGINRGLYSYVEGGGSNYGNYNSVQDDGSANATNYGTYNNVNNGNLNYGTYTAITGDNTNYGSLNSLAGNGTNYGFVANLTGTGDNYGFYGFFDVVQDNGSIALFDNRNDSGIGLISNGNNLINTHFPIDASNNPLGAGIVANGSRLGIIGYTELDDDNAVAVYGQYVGTTSTDATGIFGYSMPADNYGYGVQGYGGWIGVWGATDSNGLFGVYSYGDLGASGTKSFMIDHPLDPTHKYLKHFSIESDEVLNVYRGNVVLDANGEASIRLPNYFKAINKNFSYMLTPVGQPAPGIFVAKEINTSGEFRIAGGQSGQKISWYVYAERNDPYLQQHPEKRQVELIKKDNEQGKYLMPDLYNQPESKGINFNQNKHNKTVRISNQKKDIKIPVNTTDPKEKNLVK